MDEDTFVHEEPCLRIHRTAAASSPNDAIQSDAIPVLKTTQEGPNKNNRSGIESGTGLNSAARSPMAGDQSVRSFKMSRQMPPFALMFGWKSRLRMATCHTKVGTSAKRYIHMPMLAHACACGIMLNQPSAADVSWVMQSALQEAGRDSLLQTATSAGILYGP